MDDLLDDLEDSNPTEGEDDELEDEEDENAEGYD